MPRIRVFLCTYRRPHLLRRALRSLLAQTYSDWVCEVRNDAPDDFSPAAIVQEAADSRLQYVHHPRNLGGVQVFNEVFSAQTAPYVALLEDDNWWEPQFLERMLGALEANPDVTGAWSNQHVWEETAEGGWRDTGKSVRPIPADTSPVRVDWPQAAQCLGALHANGAMLIRTRAGVSFAVPPGEAAGIEALRERMLPHPLLYLPEALAVFSVTRATQRSRNPVTWATVQVLLAGTYFLHVKATTGFWQELWHRAREQNPRMTGTLILAALQHPALRSQLAHSVAADWRHLAIRSLRRPAVCIQLLRARRREPALWKFLDEQTGNREQECAGRITTESSRLSFEEP